MKRSLVFGIVAITILIGLGVFVSARNYVYDTPSGYQIQVRVEEGWNLLQGFHPDFISAGSQVTASNIKAVFMYSPDKNKYFEFYPENKLPSSGLSSSDEYYDDAASAYSYWVYIENVGDLNNLVYTIRFGDWTETQMKIGWNFVGINLKMYNGEYDQNKDSNEGYFSWDVVKGDCTYEKIYAWNPETRDWIEYQPSTEFKGYDFDDFLGNGMLVKVSNACILKKSSLAMEDINPPQVPQ